MLTFLLFSYIIDIEVITMKIGDKVVVARHKQYGDMVIWDDMIDARGVVVEFEEGDRVVVEFDSLGLGGRVHKIQFSYQKRQLDVIND